MTVDGHAVVLAAGAVLWREVGDGVEVALVHRPRYDDWSLPKGKVDPHEHLLETAVREVSEETGFGVRLGRPLGAVSYDVRGVPKRVTYWSGQALDGDFSPDDEVDELAWLDVATARQRVARDTDRAVLGEFLRLPHRTEPVIVLRHGKAVSRKSWPDDDAKRPLSDDGRAQSERIVGLLSAFAPDDVVSSTSTRCRETVEPFLVAAVSRFETDHGLSEEGYDDDPKLAVTRVAGPITDGRGTVLCSHRPVLPALLDTVRSHADVPIDLDLDRTPLRTAEMVVAHVHGGRVVAAERHRA